MNIYSPSSRQDFGFCPRYWWLRKQGWTTRTIHYPELCGIGGTAVSEAMAYWNRARIAQRTVTKEETIAQGLQSLVTQFVECEQQERRVTGLKALDFKDQLGKLVESAVTIVWDTDPLRGHTLVSAEHEFAAFGNMRPDVISRDGNGELVVDDYKCKFSSFDEAWMDNEFAKHFDGEQRLAYCNAAGARLFGIILVVLQPHSKRKPLKPFVQRRVSRVQEHELTLWQNDSTLDYLHMELVERQTSPFKVRGKVAPHANQYGECKYREACIEHNLDVGKMGATYIQVEEINHGTE